MSRFKDEYDLLTDLGVKPKDAMHQAMVNAVIDDERNQREIGITYDKDHVRQAIVHSRQDMILLISHVGESNRILRRIQKRVTVVIALVAAILMILLYRS